MIKLYILISFLFSFVCYGDFLPVDILDFEGSYVDPKGEAFATVFDIPSVEDLQAESGIEMSILKEESSYVLKYNGLEYFLENPPAIILNVDIMKWNSVNLYGFKNRIDFSLGYFETESEKGSLLVEDMVVYCAENHIRNIPLMDKLLDSCLNQSDFSANEISIVEDGRYDFDEDHFSIDDFLSRVFTEEDGWGSEQTKNETKLKDIDLNVNNHNFSLKLHYKVSINASGTVEYLMDSKVIKINLKKAKASFFDIKNKIFKSLEDMENPRIKVKAPYIFIDQS